ncbi:MAG: hypothetical protein IPG43_22965 [Proteobacteria bacterium]|nr:hypothetical protein [Pseudomonadota bacterium]
MKATRLLNAAALARLATAALVAASLSGCIGVVLGGAAGGASVVNDPRTAGSLVEDESIELKAGNLLRGDKELAQQTHINVTSYNQIVPGVRRSAHRRHAHARVRSRQGASRRCAPRTTK